MNATEAIDQLDPKRWADTSPAERLHLLEQVRANMKAYGDELAAADSRMKNDILGAPLYSDPVSKVGTVVPMANTVSAAIELYEAILDGKVLQPHSVEKVGEDLYDIYVFPQARKDKLMYADRKDRIRVKGEPKQVNPMDKYPANSSKTSQRRVQAAFHRVSNRSGRLRSWAEAAAPL